MPSDPDDTALSPLRVERAEPAAEGIQLLELRDPTGGQLPPFTPGAHLSVQLPDGRRRSYSLCGDPADRSRYRIAVKRDQAGRGGSVNLVDTVRPGDTLLVSPPRNLFELAAAAPSYIFVAGGIGITPIMSMIAWVRANGAKPFRLYYLTRTAEGTAFRTELSAPDLRDSVVIHHDAGDPAAAFDLWPVFEEPGKAHIYCCGPRPLMDAVRDMTGHWPSSQVHFEDFGSDLVRPRADDAPFTVRLARSGATLAVPVGTTILEAMRAHGLHVPSSCESGTCGTCRTGLLAGRADHRDLVLSPAERAGSIMVCVSRAPGGELLLDA
jgi:phthalate 4,5-dioxygenase reductase component